MRYFTFADLFTYLNLLSGFTAVLVILQLDTTLGLRIAAGLFLLAYIVDYLDGFVASRMKTARKFGMYLDTLADVCSFGFAPALIGVILFPQPLVYVSASVFLLAGVFRLARYQTSTFKGVYQGVPITTNGIVMALLLFFSISIVWIWVGYFFLMSILMSSSYKVKHI